MRDDLHENVGVTTTVAGGKNYDGHRGGDLSRTGSITALKDAHGWNHSRERRLTDADSDDYIPSTSDFEVRKTVQITQD